MLNDYKASMDTSDETIKEESESGKTQVQLYLTMPDTGSGGRCCNKAMWEVCGCAAWLSGVSV